jgi:competence protein ComEC
MKPSKKSSASWAPPSDALNKGEASLIYSRPIAAFVLALMGGILAGSHFPGYIAGAATTVLLSAALFAVKIRGRKATRWAPIIFFAALGYVSIQPWVSPRSVPDHLHSFSDETRWKISGVVDSHPREFKYLKKFVLSAETLEYKKAIYRVRGKVRVTVRGRGAEFGKGDRVKFRSRLRRPRNFNNPGGFDYQRYMAFKGLCRTAYTRGDRLQIVQKSSSADLSSRLNRARQEMATLIERSGDHPSTAILKALIIGDRSDISAELRDQFNRVGVGHILAISGLHIGIVATVAFFVFQRLLCFFQPALWRAWTRKGAAMIAVLPVCIYGLISGMSPSTQRAVIMVSAFLLTFVVERERDAFNILALAAFIILIVHPPSLFSISFQLSFMAVLSILYGITRWQARSEDARQTPAGLAFQVRRKLFAFFLVSAFAIGGTLPLVMHYFNQVSLIGLLANFIVVPLVGFGVIPCGLLSLFIYPISTQLASIGVEICIWVLNMVISIIGFLADLPFAAIKTFTPNVVEMICYYLLGWVLLQKVIVRDPASGPGLNPYRQPVPNAIAGGLTGGTGRSGVKRTISRLIVIGRWIWTRVTEKKIAVIGLGAALVLVVDAGYWIGQRHWNSNLRVTYMDVGQGNATLLEMPGGYTALIDGGGFSDNNAFDMGARVIAPFLLRNKIQTIDTLILTHPNSDHLNGLIYISEHFNVKTIWTNGEPHTTSGYRKFQDIIALKRIDMPDFKKLDRLQKINGVEVRLLYPPADFMASKASDKWRKTNNNSLVLKVSFDNISFLFPGDILRKAEKELVALAGAELTCDVLLSPQHGSRSSSSNIFLAAAQPDVVVISAGWKNRFRFPHPSVVEAYQQNGCRIFRTDLNGAIIMETDGRKLTAKSFIPSDDVP